MFRILRLVLLATALVAPLFAGAHSYAQAQPLRVGIVGLVHGHVHGFLDQSQHSPEIEIVGVAEPDKQLLCASRRHVRLRSTPCCSPIWKKCCRRPIPQAVLVYTNTYDHRRVVEICARHGVHVMMEKPLAVSLEDALAMRESRARGQDSRAGQLRDVLVSQQPRRLRPGARRRARRQSAKSSSTMATTARKKSTSNRSFWPGSPIPNSTAPARSSTSDATAPTS